MRDVLDMSVTAPPIPRAEPDRVTFEHPRAIRVITALLLGGLATFLIVNASALERALREHWQGLLFWVALAVIVNMFPVPLRQLHFTVDAPVLLAVAFLYSPAVAALVALVASFDPREVRRTVPLVTALFNRSQIALSTLSASLVFHGLNGDILSGPSLLLATIPAVAADYLTNASLVLVFSALRTKALLRETAQQFTVGRPLPFIAIYLGQGVLAAILALLSVRAGEWAVLVVLIPLFIARQALLRGEQLEALAEELRQRERLLEELLDRIQDERRDERLRVAADLHDDVLQSLTGTWMLASFVAQQAKRNRWHSPEMGELLENLNLSVGEIRQVIRSLRDSPVGRGGLIPTLRNLARDLQMHSRIPVSVSVRKLRDIPLPPETELAAYQVAREALLNAIRHADASRIEVSIVVETNQLRISVMDDGSGFDPSSVDVSAHFGLGLMRERIRMAGGQCAITSVPGQGTSLQAEIPLSAGEKRAEDETVLAPNGRENRFMRQPSGGRRPEKAN